MINRKFGVEIEFKGISKAKAKQVLTLVGINAQDEGYNHATRNHWKIVTDGSVDGGYELVSPPLIGEAGLKDTVKAVTALDDAGGRVDRQTGIHVHFDASDLTAEHVKKMMQRYAKYEQQIDAFMPESRRGNNNRYTKSIKQIVDSTRFNDATTINQMANAMGGRYFKVNLQSYARQGTVEFRQHGGSLNGRKIENWVRLLAEFIIASGQEPQAETGAEVIELNSLPRKAKIIAEMMQEGALMSQLVERTGLQSHSIRAIISRNLRGQAGLSITTERRMSEAHYRLTGAQSQDSLWRGINVEVAEFYQNRTAVLNAA